ncbi:hypothetical protein NM688_g8351 [Phlebia brevispora]|uniref:Uncharacterized protein n=1 Tax=Phlebia brevispora TaxID=194682 RepID=A0ACC1RUN8_9APHY|nr:hypothetical protein NM688_g8351 [Phlebia brevispora]
MGSAEMNAEFSINSDSTGVTTPLGRLPRIAQSSVSSICHLTEAHHRGVAQGWNPNFTEAFACAHNPRKHYLATSLSPVQNAFRRLAQAAEIIQEREAALQERHTATNAPGSAASDRNLPDLNMSTRKNIQQVPPHLSHQRNTAGKKPSGKKSSLRRTPGKHKKAGHAIIRSNHNAVKKSKGRAVKKSKRNNVRKSRSHADETSEDGARDGEAESSTAQQRSDKEYLGETYQLPAELSRRYLSSHFWTTPPRLEVRSYVSKELQTSPLLGFSAKTFPLPERLVTHAARDDQKERTHIKISPVWSKEQKSDPGAKNTLDTVHANRYSFPTCYRDSCKFIASLPLYPRLVTFRD